MTTLYDLACKVPSICGDELVSEPCITVLAQQIEPSALRSLRHWPESLSGGLQAVCALTKQAISSLYLPFTGSSVNWPDYHEAVDRSGLVKALLDSITEVVTEDPTH